MTTKGDAQSTFQMHRDVPDTDPALNGLPSQRYQVCREHILLHQQIFLLYLSAIKQVFHKQVLKKQKKKIEANLVMVVAV